MELRGDDEIWFDAGEWERYAELAGEHVRSGRVAHYVLVDADDAEALERWYGLVFGRQQVYAARPFAPAEPHDGPVAVRPGTVEEAVRFGGLIAERVRQAPVWSDVAPKSPETLREEWTEFLAEPDVTYLVAELGGEAIGYAALEGPHLVAAGTVPEARRRGAMRALWAAAQRLAAERGWETCELDWRSASTEAAACWTALGFRPTRYRLHRLVGR
jgi:hypothetical protein